MSKPEAFDAALLPFTGCDWMPEALEIQDAGLAAIGRVTDVAGSGVGLVTVIGSGCGIASVAVDAARLFPNGSTEPTNEASRWGDAECESEVVVTLAGFPIQPH